MKLEEKKLRQLMRERNYRIVAFDLDETLALTGKWKSYKYIGKPNPTVVRMLRKEKKNGSHIILHSCRITTSDNKVYPEAINTVLKWLKKNKIFVDEIWMGTGKCFSNVYVDDSAINPSCGECMERYKKGIK